VRKGRFRHGGEEGNISLLTLGLSLGVVLIVLVAASATSVHLDHVRLLRLADDVALDVADTLDLEDYYAGRIPEPIRERAVVLDQDTLIDAVTAEVARQERRYGLTDVQVTSVVSPDGFTVVVTLRARSELPFALDVLAPWGSGVILEVTSAARAY